MKSRIVCTALVAMLLVFTACGATQQANAPEAETNGETEEVLPARDEEFTTEEGTEESTTDSESATGETSANGETTTAKTEVNAPVGGSTAQIVAFYNQTANAVKSTKNITVKRHDKTEGTVNIPAIAKAFMGDGADMDPNSEETKTESFVNGKGTKDTSLTLKNFLPVRGQDYVSQLKASYVKSASCVKQGDGWIIKITLKDESNIDGFENLPDTYTSCMDLTMGGGSGGSGGPGGPGGGPPDGTRPEGSAPPPDGGNMPSMNASGSLKNGMITAVINKDGQLTSLTHSYASNMSMSMMGMTMKMDQTVKQEYQFTW